MNVDDIYAFLESRDVNTEFMKKEKIDRAVIQDMDDEDLTKFIPHYGDRIPLRSYLKKEDEKRRKKSKGTLVASLRQKLKNIRKPKKFHTCTKDNMLEKEESESELDETSENTANPYKGNQNAAKETRKIKLGIKSKADDSFLNIRVKRGGGPRDISVKKTLKKKELIERAKELYFGSSGTSKLGCVDDFCFDMQNYEEEILQDDVSVGKLYEQTGLSKLTFYLLLIPEKEELPKIQRPQKRLRTTESNTLDDDVNEDLPNPSLPVFDQSEIAGVDILSEALIAADLPLYFPIDNIKPVNVEASSGMSTVPPSDISKFFPLGISTGPPSGISTVPPSGISTGSPSSINTFLPSGISTGPPYSISTDPPSGISTDLPSDISTFLPSSISTFLPSGISTCPPSSISTGLPSGISTCPPSGISTCPPSGISTDPPSSNSTGPPNSISTGHFSNIRTVHSSDISTGHSSDIRTVHSSDISTGHSSDIRTGHSSDIRTDHSSDISTGHSSDISTGHSSGINTTHHEEIVSIGSLLPVVSDTVFRSSLENIHVALAADTDKVLRVHRVTLLDEMIIFFKDPEIMNKNISFEFVSEHGSDMNGVSRDAYSAFWLEFFRRSSEGEKSRVPALNSKWQSEEWQAIGRIFAKGFQDQNIFPVQMSPVTSIAISFGETSITNNILNDAFFKLHKSNRKRHFGFGIEERKI